MVNRDVILELCKQIENAQAEAVKRQTGPCKESRVYPVLLRDKAPVDQLNAPARHAADCE